MIISGKAEQSLEVAEYPYRGIAGRSFERHFNLADYVQMKGCSLNDGLLQIELVREVPEAMKPRRIEIKTGQSIGKDEKVRTIEHTKAA